ncbi:chymotrypsin family serine protease [Pontimicrobium aquaticum]|uniref:Trypsin-like peptidase domain-containing protein n=1 Tax=Pontimicrobium aquaticum TaxID=2565367 RepID=A0A4V5LQ58_9FLAO|nr:hypothetical protein [Pontimicrobium aquaticum]TJY34089.1 hypothetical protein E5167_12295 [Pontimicrobium aquaticum]
MKCKDLNEQIKIIDVDEFNGIYKTSNSIYSNSYSYYRSPKETDKFNTHFTVAPTDKGNGEFKKFHISFNFSKTGVRNAKIFFVNGKCTGYSTDNLLEFEVKEFIKYYEAHKGDILTIGAQFWEKVQEQKKIFNIRESKDSREFERRKHIQRIKSKVEDALLQREGVVAVDIDYKIKNGIKTDELAIIVFVEKKQNVLPKQRIPKTVQGIKTDVWETTLVPFSTATKTEPSETKSVINDSIVNPILGGISVGPFDLDLYGTLGIVLETNFGAKVMLSSAHVFMSGPHTIPGTHLSQPALPMGGHWPETDAGEFLMGFLGQPNNIDAALATVSHRNILPKTILQIGQTTGHDVTFPGDDVAKFGRRTQFTTGKVVSDTFTCNVNYPNFGTYTYYNQLRIQTVNPYDNFGLPGDSGSIVVNEDKEVVGMIMSGGETANDTKYTIANPIGDILRTFEANGIRFV